jgi:formylglycine-generating enzyme required for sulfatase activity
MALPSWNDFLERLQRDGVIRRVDPRTMQAVEELLDAGMMHTLEEFGAALASLLATTPEQWKEVQARCRAFMAEPTEFVGGELTVTEPPPPSPTGVEFRAEPEPEGARRSLERALKWLATRRLRRAVGGMLLVVLTASTLGVTAGLIVALRGVDVALQTPAHEDLSEGEAEGTTLEPDLGTLVTEGSPEDDEPIRDDPRTMEPAAEPPSSRGFIASLMLISVALVGVGLRLISAPTAQRRRAMELHDRDAADAQGPRVLYKVPNYPPFPVAAMDAAATLLARLPMIGHGLELDVDATLHATVRAGGRVTPVLASTRAAQELTILVDLERGDHPFLSGVAWVLNRWEQSGLRFVRLTFEHHPTVLRTHPERRETNLDALGRRTEGSPLVLFARATQLREYEGGHGWLRQLGPWPVRAIVDLDPRHDDDSELLPEERDSRRVLARANFRRFPFTAAGLTAMAQYVGSRGVVQPPVPDERLRPTAAIAEHLDKWASCLACVPDPSWAQLEVFRREFFAFELPDPRYIQRLLDWVSRPLPGGVVPDDPITADGTRINLPRKKVHQHLARLARADPLGRGRDLEVRAREIIQQQLRGSAPQAVADRRLRDLKLAQHAAILRSHDPRTRDETAGLEVFVGGAMEEDLERWVADQEARYREAEEVLPQWLRNLRHSLVRADLQLVHLAQWLTWRALREVAPLALVIAGAAWLAFGAWPLDIFSAFGSANVAAGLLWIDRRRSRQAGLRFSLYRVANSLSEILFAISTVAVMFIAIGIIRWEVSLELIGAAAVTTGLGWFTLRWLRARRTYLAAALVWVDCMLLVWAGLNLPGSQMPPEYQGAVANVVAAVIVGWFMLVVRRERRYGATYSPWSISLAALGLEAMALLFSEEGLVFLALPAASVSVGRKQFGLKLAVLNLLIGLTSSLGSAHEMVGLVLGSITPGEVLHAAGGLLMMQAGMIGLARFVMSPTEAAVRSGRLGPVSAPPTGRALGVVATALSRVAPIRFIGLTGGEFTMGSPDSELGRYGEEGPQHRVRVSPFAIAEHPVTQGQWREVMGNDPSERTAGLADDFPVNSISWFDVLDFLNRLSVREGLRPCYRRVEESRWIWDCTADGYRLPTEAEWEYAARAGTTTAYSFGDDPAELGKHAWFVENSERCLHRVGVLRPNPWQLFDMHGHVWEWVWDLFADYSAQPRTDPAVQPMATGPRLTRGGSFLREARFLRCALRKQSEPTSREWSTGFRCVRGAIPRWGEGGRTP